MRVGILAIQHESNTFLHQPTTMASFDRLFIGEEVRRTQAGAHNEIAGFFRSLEAEGIEAVPLLFASATPGGVVVAEALNRLVELALEQIDKAGKLDGLLLAPHGAAVSEQHPDMDGYWLSMVRRHVGPEMPIVCTLDLHGNVTQGMIDACDATIGYRTNPHLDQTARGLEAGKLIARTLRGEVRPTQAAAFPPIAINIERQLTAASPCRELYAMADAVLARKGVLSNTVMLGFPYSDVEEMGSSVIAVTDNDPGLARALADEMAAYIWRNRHDFVGVMIGVDEAIDTALKSPSPVCLLDMGDNVGGGSAGDGTIIAHALHRRRVADSFVAIYDPPAVHHAIKVGPGKTLHMSLGGHTDKMHGQPLQVDVTVVSVFNDARITETQTRHGGRTEFEMGPTAVVRTGHGLTIQLTSTRVMPFSINQVACCGLDPLAFRILVAKGVHAPVAAYAPVCPTLIRVNTPGATTADMTRHLHYKHRRTPLFPFEDTGKP
ncbi:MAG: M81 family metallopeptidase [Planctomycetes bacterium]|nr:M81 family metallopeptidase [Planctomycetota bacterium]